MDKMYFIVFALALVVVELLYFRLARAFQIIDKPNERSLHEAWFKTNHICIDPRY